MESYSSELTARIKMTKFPKRDMLKTEDDNVSGDDSSGELDLPADDDKKKRLSLSASGGSRRVAGAGVGGVSPPCCQAEKCSADLTEAKRYHRRHKVCEFHAKAPVVIVAGNRQRFCQQCSRFHELTEFDETKRSCRRRLAGHNERRRKSTSEVQGEGSSGGRRGTGTGSGPTSSQVKENQQCRASEERGRVQMGTSTATAATAAAYKHFHHIR